MSEPGRCLYAERRDRPHFAGPGRLRWAGPALAGPGRAAYRPAAFVGAPDARAPGATAVAAPPRPRLRAGHATGRAGIACGASGPATHRRATISARASSGDRAGRASGRARRRRRGLPGEDRRAPRSRRFRPASAAASPRTAPRSARCCWRSRPSMLDDFDVDLLPRKTRYSISTRRQLTDELAAIRARGFAYERAESVGGFGCVAAPIGDIDAPIAAVSVCGPLDRMTFDHRMAGPVRTTALGIWRNYDDGDEIRVQPILQQPRPLPVRALAIRVNLDPEIAALLPALNDGFPRVETMTAPQLRAVIRERAQLLQQSRAGRQGDRPDRAGPGRRHQRPNLLAHCSFRSAAGHRVRPRRRLRVLRPGLPRRPVSRDDQRRGRGRRVGRLPAGAGIAVAGRRRRCLRGRATGRPGRPTNSAPTRPAWSSPATARAATWPP